MELITRTLELLNMEHDAELTESLNNRSNCSIRDLELEGLCLSKLLVSSIKTGLFGRTLIKLKKEFASLPPHKLGPGDIVGIFTLDIKNPEYSGTVYKVSPDFIVVACDGFIEVQGKASVVALANETTYKRQRQVMERLGSLNNREHSYNLAQVILGEERLRMKSGGAKIEFFNQDLNPVQQQAVSFALDACVELGVIHGPPGTGKTTTVVELILQAVKRGIKVLATAPSNIAVDNLVEKLAGRARVVRLGHPARMMESISKYSFDSLLKHTDQYSIGMDIRKEMQKLSTNRANRNELNALRKEMKLRDRKAGEEVLERSEVVLATCISSGNKIVEEYSRKIGGFGLVVIDEAAQALECACWVPVLLGTKLILAGDHKQLPPTIISPEAASQGLQISMMERICNRYPEASVLLEIQYRMNQEIMGWSNNEFYQGRLSADASVRERVLREYPHPLVLIDTSGGYLQEVGEISKYNPGEAEIVVNFCNELKALGVTGISVITPYNAQVEILRKSLENVEIATVDGFQGREKDVVVISLVRSNDKKEVGFLKEFRRLNVAITRAKMLVCIVMDCDTVGSEKSPKFLKSLCKYFLESAVCLNFQEYSTGGIGLRLNKEERKAKPKKENNNKKKTETGGAEKPKKSVDESKFVNPAAVFAAARRAIQELTRSEETELRTEKLDAKQRHEIHELCQKLQLYHKSTGSGKNKCMIISKIFPAKAVSNAKIYKLLEQSSESEEEKVIEEEPAPVLDETDNLATLVNKNNIPNLNQKKSKKNKKAKNPGIKEEEEYDEDKFLAEAMKQASSCMYPKCDKDITLLGRCCKFCNGGFCMNHILAEVHGCADEARKDGRANFYRPPKISQERVENLKERLQDKIKEQNNRKPKKNKKKK